MGLLGIACLKARRSAHDIAISNSFGFGGPNCCVVFKRFGA